MQKKACDVMVKQQGARTRKIAFFLLVLLVMAPLLVLPLYSAAYAKLHKIPVVQNGVLDLQGRSLHGQKPLPLTGTWEFYSGQWIITNPEGGKQVTAQVPVPAPWHIYKDVDVPVDLIASYRILLKNVQADEALVAFVPGMNARYRIFLNGTLVSARGNMNVSQSPFSAKSSQVPMASIHSGVVPQENGMAELVVEIASPHVGGLYKTPFLMEETGYHVRYDSRNMIASAVVGVTVVAFACVAAMLLMGEKMISSLMLVVLDVLVFSRILFQNDYLQFLQRWFPIQDYLVNSFLQVIMLFLPVAFLLCMRQTLHFDIENKKLWHILWYDLVAAPFVLWASLTGHIHIGFLLYLIGCLPLLHVIRGLYMMTMRCVPFAWSVACVLLLALSSALLTSLLATGVLVMDVSLIPPVFFMGAMLMQLWIFLKNSVRVQQQAIEAENLRLRLKQSESDLMLSQIRPHFLYNSLIAIHTLCTDAPEAAAEATLEFAMFLRTNMNFITARDPVLFVHELEHIEHYANLELMRHQKRLTVRYDIQVTDFCVPPLSLQPLVENAIRHGACKNIAGGTVLVQTRETGTRIEIVIADDGPGFDTEQLEQPREETHGLQNVLFRLHQYGAEVEIESAPETGTRVTVLLDRRNQA